MARNKGLIALLMLGVAGVIIYNIHFFMNRNTPKHAEQTQDTAATAPAPAPATGPFAAATPSAEGQAATETAARPAIAWDQLKVLANEPILASKSTGASALIWPKRDPFKKPEKSPGPTLSPIKATALAEPVEPSYTVSAILVQGNRRLALIDGIPRQIGTHVGNGRITAIESNYVLLDTAKGTRRLELSNTPTPLISAETLDKKKL